MIGSSVAHWRSSTGQKILPQKAKKVQPLPWDESTDPGVIASDCAVRTVHTPDASQRGGHYLGRARGAPGHFQRGVRGHQAQVCTTYVLCTETCGAWLLTGALACTWYLVHSLVLSLVCAISSMSGVTREVPGCRLREEAARELLHALDCCASK